VALEVGDVLARLGFDVDTRGKQHWDRERDDAKRKAATPINQRLGFEVDDRGVNRYRDTTRSAARETGDLTRAFSAAGGGASAFSLRIGGLGGRLDHILRLMTLLSPAVYAAGGSLTALAGSAGAAAGGLGVLAASAGAALSPVVALGVAIGQRAELMSEAYKAIGDAETARAADAETSATRQVAAADSIRAAQQTLDDAQRDAARAQDDLTAARARARREVQDLREAVDDAALSERGAHIELQRAIERLAEVRADPEATRLDMREAQLAVDRARDGLSDARRERTRALEDAKQGTDTIRDAEERLAGARRAVADAQRAETRARQAGAAAATQESTAATNANEALAKLTDSERALVEQSRRTADTLSGIFRPATDAIFDSTVDALQRLDPRLRSFENEFADLADVIADAIGLRSRALAGARGGQLERILGDADEVANDLERSLWAVFQIVLNIADVGMPHLLDGTEDVADMLERWADATDDTGALRDDIDDLVRSTRLWLSLLGSTTDLLVTVLGGGRDTGDDLVRTLDRIVTRWDRFLESDDGQRRLRNFFEDARDLLEDIVAFIRGMVGGFRDTLDQLAPIVRFFADLAAHVLGIDKGADGIERIGRVFGALALLKLTGITSLVGMLLRLAGAGGSIAAIFRAISGGGGAGAGGILGELFGGRGASPARPLFVVDVAGGVGGRYTGPAPWPGQRGPAPTGGGGGGVLGRFGRLGRIGAGGALGAGLGGLAVLIEMTSTDWDELTERLDSLIEGPRDSPRAKRIREIAGALDEAKKAGDHRRMRELAGDIDEIAKGASDPNIGKGFRELARDVRETADAKSWPDLKDVLRTTQDRFRLLARDSKADLEDIRLAVRYNMGRVRDRLGEDSAAGRAAVSDNFERAIDAVERQMRRGRVTTREGMAAIRGFVARELQVYGLDIRQARNIAQGTPQGGRYGDPDANQGREGGAFRQRGGRYLARGGWLVGEGLTGLDTIEVAPNVFAAPGEWHGVSPGGGGLILNRHQAPVGELALAITRAMGGPYGSLAELGRANVDQPAYLDRALGMIGTSVSGLLSSITTPHFMQRGGQIVSVPGFPGERAARSILDEIRWVTRQFGLTLTDAFGPGHKSPGHTQFGTAADFAGGDRAMDRAVAALVRMGYLVGYDGRFGSQAWPGHGPSYVAGGNAHLHVEFGQKAGRVLEAISRVPRQIVRGGGGVGRVVQRGLDLARGGAQRLLDDGAMGSLEVPVAHGRGAAQPGQVRSWIVAGLRLAGVAPTSAAVNTIYGRVMQESGGDPRAVNNWDVNAQRGDPSRGILQTIGATFRAYMVPGHGNIWNPVHNIAAAVRYMLSRYGRLVGRGPGGYSRGGLFGPIFAQGGVRYGSNTAQGVGDTHKPKMRTLSRRVRDRISAYDNLVGVIEDLREDYGRWDRRYGLSEETMVNEETGAVDVGQTQQRMSELDNLKRIRETIRDRLIEARRLVTRIVNTYKTLIRQLERSLEAAKGKRNTERRRGIRAQIRAYKTKLSEWQDVLGDVGDDLFDADTDVLEIGNEWSEVAAILRTGQAGGLWNPPTSRGDDQAAEAVAQQAIERAENLQRELLATNAMLTTLTGPGDIGAGYANARAAVFGGAPQTGGVRGIANQAVTAVGPDGAPVLSLDSLASAGVPVIVFQQTNQMLAPDDPAVLAGLASSTVRGFAQQPFRATTREAHTL
jgi:hypothetical protein